MRRGSGVLGEGLTWRVLTGRKNVCCFAFAVACCTWLSCSGKHIKLDRHVDSIDSIWSASVHGWRCPFIHELYYDAASLCSLRGMEVCTESPGHHQ